MSNSSVEAASISLDQSLTVESDVALAIVAMLVYEQILTFSQAVSLFQAGRRTQIILFSLNYFNILATAISYLFSILPWSTAASCEGLFVFMCVSGVISSIVVLAITVLFVFAISSRNWGLSLLILGLSLVPLGATLFIDIVTWSGVQDNGCVELLPNSVVLDTVAYACALACNLTVVGSAWVYLYRSQKISGHGVRGKGTIASLLLRDGTIYFLGLAIISLVNIVVLYCTTGFLANYIGLLGEMISPLSFIFLSHLMLHLHESSSGYVYYARATPTKTWVQDIEHSRSRLLSLAFADSHVGQLSDMDRAKNDVVELDYMGASCCHDLENGSNAEVSVSSVY